MNEPATLSEIQAQQDVANTHTAPFGLRVLVIPSDLTFAACIPAAPRPEN